MKQQLLVTNIKLTKPMQPISSALHRPAFGQQHKALNILRPHYDLNDPAAGLHYPLEQRFATEGTINPKAGKTSR